MASQVATIGMITVVAAAGSQLEGFALSLIGHRRFHPFRYIPFAQ
jgi:hypothetical protein